jgi:hypothetical protein
MEYDGRWPEERAESSGSGEGGRDADDGRHGGALA